MRHVFDFPTPHHHLAPASGQTCTSPVPPGRSDCCRITSGAGRFHAARWAYRRSSHMGQCPCHAGCKSETGFPSCWYRNWSAHRSSRIGRAGSSSRRSHTGAGPALPHIVPGEMNFLHLDRINCPDVLHRQRAGVQPLCDTQAPLSARCPNRSISSGQARRLGARSLMFFCPATTLTGLLPSARGSLCWESVGGSADHFCVQGVVRAIRQGDSPARSPDCP